MWIGAGLLAERPGVGAFGSLETALRRNSNHVASLWCWPIISIDAEDYTEAERFLARALKVNPWQPEAWAYRAVLAHLRNEPQAEETARTNALKFWPANPRVEYLMGLKLSQNYRFAEGAAHQRVARQFDPAFLPAKAQLAEDLLRLGEEAEGWQLAEEVQRQDGYDVEAYNLATLHDTLEKFVTLTNRDFLVRMSRAEAEIYGAQVLELLGRAETNLCGKYGVKLEPADPGRDFPRAKGLCGEDVRDAGRSGLPGRLLRQCHHRQQPRGAPRPSLELAGDALARVLSRGDAASDAQPDAALAERRHFGL